MGYASALAWVLMVIIALFTVFSFLTSRYWVYYDEYWRGGSVEGMRQRPFWRSFVTHGALIGASFGMVYPIHGRRGSPHSSRPQGL